MLNLLAVVILNTGYLATSIIDSSPFSDIRIELPQIQQGENPYDAFFFDENPTLVMYPPGQVFDLTGYALLFDSGRLDVLTGTIISALGVVSTSFTLTGIVDGTEVSGQGMASIGFVEVAAGLTPQYLIYRLEEQSLQSQAIPEPSILLMLTLVTVLRRRNAGKSSHNNSY